MIKVIFLVLFMVAVAGTFFSVARAGFLPVCDLMAASGAHASAVFKQSGSVNLAEALLGGKGA